MIGARRPISRSKRNWQSRRHITARRIRRLYHEPSSSYHVKHLQSKQSPGIDPTTSMPPSPTSWYTSEPSTATKWGWRWIPGRSPSSHIQTTPKKTRLIPPIKSGTSGVKNTLAAGINWNRAWNAYSFCCSVSVTAHLGQSYVTGETSKILRKEGAS